MINSIKTQKSTCALSKLRQRLTLLLIGYFCIGITSELCLKKEIFPLFSWFLFSKTPNEAVNFTVILYKHNEQILNPPIPFQKAPKAIASSGVIAATSLINQLGNSYIQGNHNLVESKRKLLEENYFKGEIEYGLIMETYNPIEKWKYGKVKQEILAKFKSGESE